MSSDYNQIREENKREYGLGNDHLAIYETQYTDRTHFILELLQNAEDAEATRILFELYEERLEVKHNGRRFNELDVRGICGFGKSTKDNLTQIGKFGIGFKSVYAYTSAPEVHSGDEHFRIEDYMRPYPTDPREAGTHYSTLFCFPFNKSEAESEEAFNEIATRLRNLSARTLLFLSTIKEIEYKLLDESSGLYMREEKPHGPAKRVSVIGQNNGEDEEENWLVFEKRVSLPKSENSGKVEVAFKFNTEVEQIIPIKDAKLSVYFPTKKPTRLGFLIQGPYRTTPSREDIPKDNSWNEKLVGDTASLILDALIGLREMGLLTVSLLKSMPIRMDDFGEGSMFLPIAESVRTAFREQELLPADDGTFVDAKNAKIARGSDLKKLLNQDQLRFLFESDNQIKWLIEGITKDSTPELHT